MILLKGITFLWPQILTTTILGQYIFNIFPFLICRHCLQLMLSDGVLLFHIENDVVDVCHSVILSFMTARRFFWVRHHMRTLWGIIYWYTSRQRGGGLWAWLWDQRKRQKESLMKFLWSAFYRSPLKYILMKSKLSGLKGEESRLLCITL